MANTALTPVFLGLRTGLHVLFTALVALVVIRAPVEVSPSSVAAIVVSAIFLATYGLGGYGLRLGFARLGPSGGLWLSALAIEWMLLLLLIPEAAYLVFPLSFLFLHLLPGWWGTLVALGATGLSIGALGLHSGFSVGGVVGPLVGAGVSIVIGLGYRSLTAQATERERLMQELVDTRGQLAATEHEAGVLAERARLAREIHDTVA